MRDIFVAIFKFVRGLVLLFSEIYLLYKAIGLTIGSETIENDDISLFVGVFIIWLITSRNFSLSYLDNRFDELKK